MGSLHFLCLFSPVYPLTSEDPQALFGFHFGAGTQLHDLILVRQVLSYPPSLELFIGQLVLWSACPACSGAWVRAPAWRKIIFGLQYFCASVHVKPAVFTHLLSLKALSDVIHLASRSPIRAPRYGGLRAVVLGPLRSDFTVGEQSTGNTPGVGGDTAGALPLVGLCTPWGCKL